MANQLKYGNFFYRAYRKIKFISRNGSLFILPALKSTNNIDFPVSTFRVISFNSLSLFLLAYLSIYLLNLMVTGVAAVVSNIPATVYYHGLDYIIRGKDWTTDSINIVFSSGPMIMLILSVVFIIIYISVAAETGMLRLFLLWALYHSLTRCFGEILVGAILNQGFGYVILYMFIMDTGKLILTISTFVAMFTIGLFLARFSLFSANIYFNELKQSNRLRFVLNQFLYPFFAGNIIIFIVKLPEVNIFDIAVNATQILFLIPVMILSGSIEDLYFDEDPRTIRLIRILPVAALILFLLFRIIFGFGIRLSV
jgi:hypothetical protein